MSHNAASPENKAAPASDAVKTVDWQDFRDHIATADQSGQRKWIYPRKVRGRFFRWRTWFSWLLLLVMFAGPFVTINGNPLLLLNIVERKFVVLGQIFWPQDMILFAIALLVCAVSIVVFTTAFGRLWCGWACPQTVMMEMVFRQIEFAIEGDAPRQRELNREPWTAEKAFKKLLKHGIFFTLSFIVGNVLLCYLIGWRELWQIITDPPARHLVGLAFMVGFALLFYGIFARFREQACTFICPYGRLQSLLVDDNTVLVAYDHKRGEKRGPLRHVQTFGQRRFAGLGDCVACNQCVAVCPTGIDIRNGAQMECVQCTACIDACDAVMDKVGNPRGLIRYASLNGIERHQRLQFTPRMAGYSVVLAALAAVLGFMLCLRSDVEATILRAPGSLFQQMPDGRFSNLYTVRLLNKTSHDMPVELKLERPPGTLQVMGVDTIVVASQKASQNSVLIELDPSVLHPGTTPLVIDVYSNGKKLEALKTAFIGPRN
ncbi:MAG TPA: cytochrome c oxidase accessory protein CcoG [Candidatus Acidoferrales bacterium]|nr:cytochrome c oxidase accessory protein CcoG [Candidatus Acidoferrales bacterium]